MIKLYHYSSKNFNTTLKVDFFGINTYSNASVRLSNIKRLYFYINNHDKEEFFYGAEFLYIVIIDEKKLYNLNIDELKLNTGQFSFDELLEKIKTLGFSGLYGDNGYNIAILFYDIKYHEKIRI